MNRIAERFGADSPITATWTAAACAGKAAFDSPKVAREVASKRPFPATHFRCPICGKFHIGGKARGPK